MSEEKNSWLCKDKGTGLGERYFSKKGNDITHRQKKSHLTQNDNTSQRVFTYLRSMPPLPISKCGLPLFNTTVLIQK